ncbi:ankyrin repeat domain-containing protein [Streptomyces sp. NPDC060030]|uniref:ankyrin repeat domain-containing protein n=1 Tax=Streptomyces sp. NPDC060030 TaxID=3347042 RepID=UPI00367C06DF
MEHRERGREPSEGLDARLLTAARGDDPQAVRELLEAGAHVNSTGGDGITALGAAVAADSYETARLLLDAGADADLRSRGGPLRRRWGVEVCGAPVSPGEPAGQLSTRTHSL